MWEGGLARSVIIQMREAITNLCKQESQLLQRLIAHHSLDANTSSKTQKYYRELRKLTHLFDPQPADLLMRAAIIIAEKAQVVYTLNGERVRGLALCLNEMLRQRVGVRELLPVLGGFVAHSKAADEQLREDVGQLVSELSFGVNFLEKFERALRYFELEEVAGHAGYREEFTAFAWLLFLQARQHLKLAEECEADYLLIAVLYLTVRHGFEFLRPRHAPQLSGSRLSQKNLVSSILQRLFQVFLIDDLPSFKRIASLLDDYFDSLLERSLIRCTALDSLDFLAPALLPLNYRRLDLLYQRTRPPHSLDYRLLLPQRTGSLTPRRFSQLSQRAGDKRRNFKQKSFASHKMLTFEPETEALPVGEDSQRHQPIKLPPNLKVSPSNTRTPMLWAFRHSPSSPIHSYMHREVRQRRTRPLPAHQEQPLLACIHQVLSEYCAADLDDKTHLAYNYYLVLSQKFEQENCGQEDEEGQLSSSILAYTLLITLCSLEEVTVDGERVRAGLSSIQQRIETDDYWLWLVNSSFLRMADRLPSQLREMASLLEDIILNELIWQSAPNMTSRGNQLVLVRRVMGKLESHVSRVMAEFSGVEECDRIEEELQRTVKYVLLEVPQVMVGCNSLTIMLCCAYLVFRTNGLPLKFNQIVTAFQQINRLAPGEYRRIVNEIQSEEDATPLNIIEFYNSEFLPTLKQHLPNIRHWNCHLDSMTQQQETEAEGEESRPMPREGGSRHSQRYSFQSMKENCAKRHLQTEESQEQREVKRLYSQASPAVPVEVLKQRTEGPLRNETTMRSRPITSFLGWLNTEKTKSPNVIR